MQSGDESRQENTYWSREIASILKIADSTLRKWCRVLESHGYRFLRDDQDRRAFTDHDAVALRSLKELTQDKGVALENAAKAVVERFFRDAVHTVSPSGTVEIGRYEDGLKTVLEHVSRQEEFNQKLVRQLEEQQRYIEESMKRRDEQLMAYLRETMEVKKELAAGQQVKPWWKLW